MFFFIVCEWLYNMNLCTRVIMYIINLSLCCVCFVIIWYVCVTTVLSFLNVYNKHITCILSNPWNGASFNRNSDHVISQGENRFIESICQTIFSIDELLEIITDENIDNNLKRPYLRFLLWVYLNTAGGMVDSGSADIPHDR